MPNACVVDAIFPFSQHLCTKGLYMELQFHLHIHESQ